MTRGTCYHFQTHVLCFCVHPLYEAVEQQQRRMGNIADEPLIVNTVSARARISTLAGS